MHTSECVESRSKVFTKELIARLSKYGDQSDFLICIVGMPRSGTTLLEQILSSQPNVVGLGERSEFFDLARHLPPLLRSRRPYPLCCTTMSPEAVQKLSARIRKQLCQTVGSTTQVVTKLPGDFWEIGLIKILFPRAKIIHSIRHPIDTCVSCFMQNFKYVDFATELELMCAEYTLYRRMMEHWRSVLSPGELHESSYESLVMDPEPAVRGLFEYSALPYHENWTEFCKLPKRVDTASKWQVRRPIYSSSVQKWRNYARFLGPLLELGDDNELV